MIKVNWKTYFVLQIKNAESEITTGHIYCVTKSCLRQILEIDFSYEIMFPQTLALESKVGVIAAALIIVRNKNQYLINGFNES